MPRRPLYLTMLALSIGAPAVLPVAADEVTVPADRDNTLYEDSLGNLSNGAGDHVFAGVTQEARIRRAVVHFDVTVIPPGAVIESVEVTLDMSMTVAGPTAVSVHRLTADWGEGTSDAPGNEGGGDASTIGDATWVHRFFDTDTWAAQGGDFVAKPSAVETVDQVGSYTWGSTDELVADVQGWVDDPGVNFGWLWMGEEGSTGTAKRFDSRESAPEGTGGPRLRVVYQPPVPVELQTIEID